AKMEEAGHQFTKNNANQYTISLSEAHMLMDAAGVPKFHERKKNNENKPWIINVQNQKGGTGKSKSEASGLRKTIRCINSMAHSTSWRRSDGDGKA
ncbi:hypothetical protein, partial [Salmonella enterica]|uniref:hypothetical protein n=1 Tax=Salmonella enterica TaxID=28901 RepID=UPI003075B3BC